MESPIAPAPPLTNELSPTAPLRGPFCQAVIAATVLASAVAAFGASVILKDRRLWGMIRDRGAKLWAVFRLAVQRVSIASSSALTTSALSVDPSSTSTSVLMTEPPVTANSPRMYQAR